MVCSHSQNLIHSGDIFQNFLTPLTSMEFYRNICQFPAFSTFCPCTSSSTGLCGDWTLCGLTLRIYLAGLCPTVMDRVTQGRTLSRTQIWAQSCSTKQGEKSISSEDLWQISLQTISFPSTPCGTEFWCEKSPESRGTSAFLIAPSLKIRLHSNTSPLQVNSPDFPCF